MKAFDIKINKPESGFVSIVVATMIMVILALITIGFTRIMQREQRQALDRQLSRQALYAAESGVNDVLAAINDGTLTETEKIDCAPPDIFNNGEIDEEGNIEYTCVQYDKDPTEIIYELSPNKTEIAQFTSKNNNFQNITFNWGITSGSNNDDILVDSLPPCGSFEANQLPSSRPKQIPILRIDLTSNISLDRASLIKNTEYIYAIPCSGTTPTVFSFDTNTRADIVQVACNGSDSRPCTLVIDNLDSIQYSSRLKSIYVGASVKITGEQAVTSASVEFLNLQTFIDVTARSNDVIRRMRATVPFSNTNDITGLPEAVIHSFDGVCKLLGVDDVSSPPVVDYRCT